MSGRVLFDLLEAAADEVPDQPVIITRSGPVTYARCAAGARAYARGLQRSGLDRFAIVHDDAATVLALLAAASATGREACQYPSDIGEEELSALADAFDHPVVVTDRDIESDHPAVVPTADLEEAGSGFPERRDAVAPVLILTTGTTGERKGARHDWARLVAGVEGRRSTPGARWLVGYDLHQFAGVQLLLHVVATRSTLVERPPRPVDACDLMREHAVTHASATPTYWRFVIAGLDEATVGAVPLEQITLGGEAVPPALLDDLERLFPDARVSQVYASTEFGSSVSVRDRQAGLPLSVLDRDDDADVCFRIEEGELWARSRVGMLGYHGARAEPDAWRPTGDLVEIRDGRIRFVGRTSDRINVGGVKVHPLPVEEVIADVDGVALVRVYGRENPLTGQIVATDLVAEPGVDRTELEQRVREACAVLPRAARPRVINLVDHLETRGNKLVRNRPTETP